MNQVGQGGGARRNSNRMTQLSPLRVLLRSLSLRIIASTSSGWFWAISTASSFQKCCLALSLGNGSSFSESWIRLQSTHPMSALLGHIVSWYLDVQAALELHERPADDAHGLGLCDRLIHLEPELDAIQERRGQAQHGVVWQGMGVTGDVEELGLE